MRKIEYLWILFIFLPIAAINFAFVYGINSVPLLMLVFWLLIGWNLTKFYK